MPNVKPQYLLSLIFLLYSCTTKQKTTEQQSAPSTKKEIERSSFQSIIDSARLNGSILLYDLEKNTYYSNDFVWARKPNLPASTFKITHSIIALETGIAQNDSTILKWDGEDRRLENWEQDLMLREAFHYSCVPCYQEIARSIGPKRMAKYLDSLKYGQMQVDSSNIDMFWLQGNSRINQFEQINFLSRFHRSKLPISERTEKIMKRMMIIEQTDTYTLRGKTGWSIANEQDNGWFVGYIVLDNKAYFFATNVEPTAKFDMHNFPQIRKEITFHALEEMLPVTLVSQ
jgi:beta-lactamase class D